MDDIEYDELTQRTDRARAEQLMAKYPEFFLRRQWSPTQSCMYLGLECQAGWHGIIKRMCDLLIQEHVPVQFEQLKEKFGHLRVYWGFAEGTSGEDADRFTPTVQRIVDWACDASASTCEICGAPGSTDTVEGYTSTLCPWHHYSRLRREVREQRIRIIDLQDQLKELKASRK